MTARLARPQLEALQQVRHPHTGLVSLLLRAGGKK
jgi:hypothetical protein